jgi:arylsulfatase A
MVVRGPGRVPAGAESGQVWAFWDFLPTAAAIAGAEGPPGLDGISVLPVLEGRREVRGRTLYWEFHEGGFSQAALVGDWKAVRASRRSTLELYDLRTDIGEKRDVAGEHPDIVAEMEAVLRGARTESEIWKAPRRGRI